MKLDSVYGMSGVGDCHDVTIWNAGVHPEASSVVAEIDGERMVQPDMQILRETAEKSCA